MTFARPSSLRTAPLVPDVRVGKGGELAKGTGSFAGEVKRPIAAQSGCLKWCGGLRNTATSHPCRVVRFLSRIEVGCCKEVTARSAVGTRYQPRPVPPLEGKSVWQGRLCVRNRDSLPLFSRGVSKARAVPMRADNLFRSAIAQLQLGMAVREDISHCADLAIGNCAGRLRYFATRR